MNLVDSCGWLEYLADGSNADFFAPVLENTVNLLVPSLCMFEVFKRVLQQKDEDLALQAVALMKQGKVVDLTESIALQAAKISCDLRLPMADSIILATAREYEAVLWTQDGDFEGVEGVRFVGKG
ncbi:MAG: type II toxin-antitoxin system VapC family toxin [bacterium]